MFPIERQASNMVSVLKTISILIVIVSPRSSVYAFLQTPSSVESTKTHPIFRRRPFTSTISRATLRQSPIINVPRGGASYSSSSSTALNFVDTAVATIDVFFRTAPYTAAFVTCCIQSSAADLLAQLNAARQTQLSAVASNSKKDGTSTSGGQRAMAQFRAGGIGAAAVQRISFFRSIFNVKRNLSFLIYGGFYLGCAFEWLYNTIYPKLFGTDITLQSVMGKVVLDIFILAPLVTLPVSYVIKAVVCRTSIRQEMQSYWKDVTEQHLLSKYCALYGPVTAVAFTVVPAHYRVSFFAIMDFFWLLAFSSIWSTADPVEGLSSSSQ